uniref:WD repeat-containing protein 25 isoform X1 n=1 Tax=Geotrypetes seraphini TaxID=260995 RepID=A0A6P8RPP4_GEOSA|nr:WD repeat-containing protein 25 isoform X1 [Geotrypetes seraphini]XP_033807434.1 WD repeat-containing protein 25 isoform X1 [Geotrypetes seraphini]XP_033807435.1 WD repeat-containing protein 25 isoform X1 [Geotrypetes seraphini]XP_033807436.1 WD repeat-containing protein 25 isoform X1 [Geotrypetes seraphini]
MTSLVSYDDSDSEPDVWKTEIPNGSNQGKSLDCPTTFQTKHFSADELDPGKPYKQKSITNIGDICPDSVNEDSKPFPVTYSSKVSLDTCSGSTSPYLCYKSQGQSLDSLLKSVTVPANVQKRVHEDHVFPAVGIKPYIPKRMRQEQPSALKNLTKDGEKQKQPPDSTIKPVKGEEHLSSMTFRVSETIKPYLEAKYKATEISRSLVFQMCEHQGPVNKVQWCPVQQYSHMLLSASMDKSFKVWDAVDTGSCLKTYLCHSGAVRDVQWSSCGRVVLSGGFDSMLYLTDIETGKPLFSSENEFKISTLKFHPTDRNVFVCGGFSPSIRAWDIRDCKVIKIYKAAVQQTLDILFLPEGKEFFSSTDSVSRDSADRTIIAWDFQTTARISNQIFHERYTCPCLTLHPKDSTFVAQTNGNYMALFSTQWPYKINKKKRYEEHKVEGFAVGCEFSPDGSLLATGSSEGRVFLYNYNTSRVVRNFPAHNQACVNVSFHPVLPSLFATSDWSGEIKIWQ